MIGQLLGRARAQTTARHPDRARDSVEEPTARIAASIGEDILGRR